MTEVKLKYNPYTKEKSIFIDGKEQSENFVVANCGSKYKELSEWSEAFYINMRKAVNDHFTVYFTGIARDYEFMQSALKKIPENKDSKIELKKEKITVVEDKMNELKSLFAKMQKETPFATLQSETLKEIFDEATDDEFEIAVVAPMSSGKSTLINAMLGTKLLPAKRQATTATLAHIHDRKSAKNFSAECYDFEEKKIAEYSPLTYEDIETNNNTKIKRIEIYGDIGGIDSKHLRLVLTDTPGPNNAGENGGAHRTYVDNLLDVPYKPMIMFVLNATQPEINDQKDLLKTIAEKINSGDGQSRDRFIFILNMADDIDIEDDGNISNVIKKAKNFIARDDIGIKGARILPTDSLLARCIRQKTNGESLTRKEEMEFESKINTSINYEGHHFSDHADFLSPATFDKLAKKIETAKNNGATNELALLYTGVPSVELAITEYLEKYALPAKLAKAVAAFNKQLDEYDLEAKETNKLKGNEKEKEKLQDTLKKIQHELDAGKKGEELKNKIRAINTKELMDKALAESIGKMWMSITPAINERKEDRISKELAIGYINEIEKRINYALASYVSDIEKILENILKKQAEECIAEYETHVKNLVKEAGDYELPAIIFGGAVSITLDQVLTGYTKTERVKVGSHRVENKGFRAGVARFFGLDEFLGRSGYRTIDDYADKDFVYFAKMIKESILPSIEKFENEKLEEAKSLSEDEDKKLKDYFFAKLDKLGEIMKKTVAEKEANLADQQKFEQMIEQNSKNLEWLKSFRNELNSLLHI